MKAQRMGRGRRSLAGFTLIEMLVILLIIAVLFAIAAPGWNVLMNRQRVNVVRDQVVQIIRQAQNDARRTHVPKMVVFDPNAAGIPRAGVLSVQRNDEGETVFGLTTLPVNWQTLGNGDIKAGVLEFSTYPKYSDNMGRIVFNSNGFVDPVSSQGNTAVITDPEAASSVVFVVKVRQKNTSSKTNRCVIVKTILGALETGESDRCDPA